MAPARAQRFSQGVTASLLAVAYALDAPALVLVTGLALASTALFGATGNPWVRVFGALAHATALPGGRVAEEPTRFAALVGTLFLVASLAAFALGAALVAWTLVLLVAALALLAAATGLCVGCEAYALALRWRSRTLG